jgi:hypothetical protein
LLCNANRLCEWHTRAIHLIGKRLYSVSEQFWGGLPDKRSRLGSESGAFCFAANSVV